MMKRHINSNIINNNCYKMDYNPYSMNNHRYAATKHETWRRRHPINGRNWRIESCNYGNLMASGDDGTRYGKIRNNIQFRNRKNKNVNKFNMAVVLARFQPYVEERKERVMETPAKTVAVADGNLLAGSVKLGDVEERELDVYGTMSRLIRIKSDGDDGVDCDDGGPTFGFSDEDTENVQFERILSKYEIALPKSMSGAGAGGDLESWGEGRSWRLEKENVMMKQSLSLMDWDMDDLKQRMEVVEM